MERTEYQREDYGSESEDTGGVPSDAPVAANNNPKGINGHKNCPPKMDERLNSILKEYHRKGVTNRDLIKKLLLAEHGIEISSATISRRRKALGLLGAGPMTKQLSEPVKRQLVLDQLAKNPSGTRGPAAIKEGILYDTGIMLTRTLVRDEMMMHEPDGFKTREPSAKRIKRKMLVSIGPHEEWSGDGHDKLSDIGFPIWGMRDKWSRKWLGLWVVPNNRLKESVAYLYLSLIKKHGGMPEQSTTDCGSETTMIFGLATALREMFSDLPIEEFPAHRFLKSVHNITIERGWLHFWEDFGEDVKIFWDGGREIFDETNEHESTLVQWLWSTLVQAELDKLVERLNNHKIKKHKNSNPLLPISVSPNTAMAMPEVYGGENRLQAVDMDVIDKLMTAIGDKTLQFVSPDYAEHAQGVLNNLGEELRFDTIWLIFQRMKDLMH